MVSASILAHSTFSQLPSTRPPVSPELAFQHLHSNHPIAVGCLADERAQQDLHMQQGVSSPAMACVRGSRGADTFDGGAVSVMQIVKASQ